MQNELANVLYDRFPAAVSKAIDNANQITAHWASRINDLDRSQGGYHWITYKAICRRQGLFSNAQGNHDWNEQLCKPMITKIMNRWDKCFNWSIPNALRNLPRSVEALLSTFHKQIESRALQNGSSPTVLQMLSDQSSSYKSAFHSMNDRMKLDIWEKSKEANRQFKPVVTAAMRSAYDECVNDSGPGSYMRMKTSMAQHVDIQRHGMFSESCQTVERALDRLMANIEKKMLSQGNKTFVQMKQDYTSALLGEKITHDEIRLRGEVYRTVEGVTNVFRCVVGRGTDKADGAVRTLDGAKEIGDIDAKHVKTESEQAGEAESTSLRFKSLSLDLDQADRPPNSTNARVVPDSLAPPADQNADTKPLSLTVERSNAMYCSTHGPLLRDSTRG